VQARYVAREIELYGRTIQKDAIMLLLNGSANRDERHFARSDEFDIRREHGALPHLSFGIGAHHCLGSALARLEGTVALEEILKRWSEWEVDYSRAAKAHTSSVRGWQTLPVRPRRA
jgi:cytochrome P450